MSEALNLDALPRAPGVYVFHGDSALPLYIGKSVDIRSRVLSHLRNPDEERMLSQTRRIEAIETAGEIGALLLESQMIKTHSPLYNQRLRRIKKLCSLQLVDEPEGSKVSWVDDQTVQPGITPDLFGLFSSRKAAKDKLQSLAQQHRLCLQLLGLEPVNQRGCFGWQTKQCAGACTGHESRADHDRRLRDALRFLQVHTWPFAGAVDVVEKRGDWLQKHRINNWGYLGTWCSRREDFIDKHLNPSGFDADCYQILLKPVLLQTLEIQSISS